VNSTRILALTCALVWAVPAVAADIVDDFKLYYRQQVQEKTYVGVLDFLLNGKADPLAAAPSRKVTIDRANGYLQIADNAGQDQVLTMAIYRQADGQELLVIGSSNCADACNFSVELFRPSGGRLASVAPESAIPKIDPVRFFKPGQVGPANTPTMNYVPARIGTGLTVKPWYGYEVEAQMPDKTRAALQDVVLTWDRANGRFR
jgi:hypothetical protein